MPPVIADPSFPPQAHVEAVSLGYVWDVATLNWIRGIQAGGGGGGGAVTVADGADVAEGATTDAAATGDGSVIAILKRLRTLLNGGLPSALVSDRLKVDGSGVTQPVSGTFWQATQPVSGTVGVSGSVAVTGPLTDSQLRASAVPVSGTVATSKTDLTPSAPAVASVGTGSAQAVAANANRKGLILRNVSSSGQRISLGFGATAVLDSGVTLYVGDSFCMGEYDFDVGAVNAIASAASGSLGVQEYAT